MICKQQYIVYMGELPEESVSFMDVHHSLLSDAIGDETIARNSRIHSYGRSFNGFVARLLPHEAQLLSQKGGVISVFPNKAHKLLTTRSWDFLGMPENVKRNNHTESNIIVALLDSGIWPNSPSFDDKGFGPPPPKWKGKCSKGLNFTGCNNKVIGAQFFDIEKIIPPNETSPLDFEGHGTHTASTAAGIFHSASLYGLAQGTARGGAPSARIAAYKVCWGFCLDSNILAAFDAAIADGVDIISVSLGGPPRRLFEDSIAIGSFHALKKGILTVCAAGNDGPDLSTVQNAAPWVVTVAASTIDRKFQTDVKLGNGEKISGIAVNTFSPKKQLYQLTNGELAQNSSADTIFGNASTCYEGTLIKNKVKGNIVHCQGAGGDYVINELGGAGTIMSRHQYEDTPFPTVTPGTYVTIQDGQKIDKYINSTRSAQAVIFRTRTVKISAPAIASFSSRGPQLLNPHILKPDISAPGVAILAAYTKFTTLTGKEGDRRVVKYSVDSGTSMACPHVSGAAAYVKSFHPNWSPAAIKSALMTTTKAMKIKPLEAELASGSGQMNPTKALNPGLIYDIGIGSYISFLCKEGYSNKDIALLTGSKKYNCSSFPSAKGTDGLNYPSMHLQVGNPQSNFSALFYRTVTNVGDGKSIYKAKVKSPKGLSITVTPNILVFSRPNQKKSFKVTLKGNFFHKRSYHHSGSLVWSDSKHNVKSPILVYRKSVQHIVNN
ncbi:hypothetical protein BUALT_Bualt09G0089900 [Buddleja alternifolia]|uniref:Uncharacterized protein n=1 Tax=Buddleja alternifolia TaxID=168488 RepID=A0AAV6XBX2_9LAMI|nr:hypothetical protein BUALT_Bualt09G0089900 [Buddleja alternifolia]